MYLVSPRLIFNAIDSAMSFAKWKKYTAEVEARSDSMHKKLMAYIKLDDDNKILVGSMEREKSQAAIVHRIELVQKEECEDNLINAKHEITRLKFSNASFKVLFVGTIVYIVYDTFLKK